MTNPFDDANATYLVLVNEQQQHSLWPARNDIPAGWRAVRGPASRQDCLDHIEANWTDLRPKALRRTSPA